jgi:hypothetical protein
MVSRGFRQILLSWFDASAGVESGNEPLVDLLRPIFAERRASGFAEARGQ